MTPSIQFLKMGPRRRCAHAVLLSRIAEAIRIRSVDAAAVDDDDDDNDGLHCSVISVKISLQRVRTTYYQSAVNNVHSNCRHLQGGPKKPHKVNDTIILQPYVIESCGFQQNVPKEISYVTKVNICIQQLNILCYCCWKLNCAKKYYP